MSPRVDGMVPDILWKVVEWFRKVLESFRGVQMFWGSKEWSKSLVGTLVQNPYMGPLGGVAKKEEKSLGRFGEGFPPCIKRGEET
jgi:hypothetical protein